MLKYDDNNLINFYYALCKSRGDDGKDAKMLCLPKFDVSLTSRALTHGL